MTFKRLTKKRLTKKRIKEDWRRGLTIILINIALGIIGLWLMLVTTFIFLGL